MAEVTKRLAAVASAGAIGTADTLFDNTATAGHETVTSTIIICNTSAVTQSFCLATSTTTSFVTAGYIAKELTIEPGGFYAFTIGLCLDVSCRYLLFSGTATSVVASVFGAKTTP